MPDVGRVFGDEGQMAGLTGGLLHRACDGATKWLVVCKDHKAAPLKEATEVLDREIKGQKLSVKGGVILLGRGQLLREESQWLIRALAQDCADSDIRGIGRQGD